MKKDETTLAQLLHEASSQCSKVTQKVLDECKAVALKGESTLKMKCSAADYECVHHNNLFTYSKMPETPLVTELRENGFHLTTDYEFGFFINKKHYLIINW